MDMTIEQRLERVERSLRRWRGLAVAAGVVLAAVVAVGAQQQDEPPAGLPQVEHFTARQIRFDESLGKARPLPVIPKGWRLVAVANGDGVNANSLWFEDANGALHTATGFHDAKRRKFVLDETIHTLARQ